MIAFFKVVTISQRSLLPCCSKAKQYNQDLPDNARILSLARRCQLSRKNVCDVDTNFALTRLCYNVVLDEKFYLLFALFGLQANQHEIDKQLSDGKKLRHID